MAARVIERRQHRRVGLEVQVELRTTDPAGVKSPPLAGRARNVSLAGFYAIMPAPFPLEPGTPVYCSVNIPEESRRQFPFMRLLGKGYVVRILPHQPDEESDGHPEVGVAVSFAGDVTALGAMGGHY